MKKIFLASFVFIIFFSLFGWCDNNTEFVVEDDLTINGTEGTYLDPDVELKGFVVIGATQPTYTANISTGPGNVIINGILGVSSGAYIVGNTTITYITSATFSGASSIFIGGGTGGYLLRSKSSPVGELEWVNPLDLDVKGDNLGNHIATMTLSMANFPIINISSLAITGAAGMSESDSLLSIAGSTMVVLNNGNVGIGTANPSGKFHIVGSGDGTTFFGLTDSSISNGIVMSDNGSIITMGSGFVGISTNAPQARLDVKAAGSTASDMVQIWRDSNGVIVGSMSATGVMMASKFIGDGTQLTGIATLSNVDPYRIIKADASKKLVNAGIIQGDNSGDGITVDASSLTVVNTALFKSSVAIQGGMIDLVQTDTGQSYSLKVGTSTTAYHLVVSTTGNVGIGTTGPGAKLDVAGDIHAQSPLVWEVNYNDVYPNSVTTVSTAWADMPGMSITFTMPAAGKVFAIFSASMCGNEVAGYRSYWQMLLDDSVVVTGMKYNSDAWELDTVELHRVLDVSAGSHTIKIQWKVDGGTLHCPHVGLSGDVGHRTLTVIPLV